MSYLQRTAGLDGDPIDFEWKSFPGAKALDILHKIQADLQGKTMFNGIELERKDNEDSCALTSRKINQYATSFVTHDDPTCHHIRLHILENTCFLLRSQESQCPSLNFDAYSLDYDSWMPEMQRDSFETRISKCVTNMVRHHDQDERETDGARHWDGVLSVLKGKFRNQLEQRVRGRGLALLLVSWKHQEKV